LLHALEGELSVASLSRFDLENFSLRRETVMSRGRHQVN
jgi:hypothetical protein